ncbi:hypothetical protein IWQ61_007092 [Dispira simplex]|nr:hypothetical protein IWQ61_007092 [Dispira simplex]
MAEQTHTLQNQATLPRLPIPTLRETADRYLESIKPFTGPKEWENTQVIVEDFIKSGGKGEQLQTLLQKYGKTQPLNWVRDWWLDHAYLRQRDPLLLSSSYYALFEPDPNHPRKPQYIQPEDTDKGTPTASEQAGYSQYQLRRAAHLIHEHLVFMELLYTYRFQPEQFPLGPLCMIDHYSYYTAYRMPLPEKDEMRQASPLNVPYIVVMVRDQLYRVEVYAKSQGRVRLQVGDIEDQLYRVVQDVMTCKDLDEPVGVLSTQQRDEWAGAYAYVNELHSTNAETLNAVVESLFIVCLDDYHSGKTLNERMVNAAVGRKGLNRWYDKFINILLDNQGNASMLLEHSVVDAQPSSVRTGYTFEQPARWPEPVSRCLHDYEPPKRLRFVANNRIKQLIQHALQANEVRISDSMIRVQTFNDFGSSKIRRQYKLQPNGFVQLALQLAYYRVHHELTATYEPANCRIFLGGRTETVRVVCQEVVAFVRAMDDPSMDRRKVYQLLQAAIKRYIDIYITASHGQGVDRHLFGLQMAHLYLTDPQERDELHPVFTDQAFIQSSTWRLSTSTVMASRVFTVGGFAAVVPEKGYGLHFLKFEDRIHYGLEGKKSGGVDVDLMTEAINQALRDLSKLCETVLAGTLQHPAKL